MTRSSRWPGNQGAHSRVAVAVRRVLTRWLPPVLGGAVALALAFWLYRDLDLGRFLEGLAEAQAGWILMLAATILLEQLLNGWKWRQLLHDVKPVRTLRLTGALLAGYGANVLVPLGISPLVRSWLVARMEGLKMGTVLTTTIIARFIDGVVFALFAGLVAMAGQLPQIGGNLELGLAVAGALNFALFGTLLWAMYRFRTLFAKEGPLICRLFDFVARWFRANGAALRAALCAGVVWPRSRLYRFYVILGAVAAKLVAASHYLWAGLSVGVVLAPFDYLFLMVFAGFSLVLSRFVRVPGGFVIGSALAFDLLGVPEEDALLMILFNWMLSIILVVGIGLVVLWQSGIDIRRARAEAEAADVSI
ncbi:lysylphosphatidylglycerol synthase transmembrane domain-containing protein [Acuticoccus sp. MNP-M23]|uniref:lysylphosphatidylglycerol synthase transmembrane domain-containing protein n=1 Tax=Acuticoccus sp. MNP-M23 TaxID=3072793 RepID=UPI002815A376|nr:lysylphosphatidylglycerol synthase transmembrane domain-containing protein [Acuticoccus sp. MNP-M23]WMS44434.1 lysylphosphatidylglycerol synthase transmembrane domain-containing protein [Acuticoccus sp. MNP-M23]